MRNSAISAVTRSLFTTKFRKNNSIDSPFTTKLVRSNSFIAPLFDNFPYFSPSSDFSSFSSPTPLFSTNDKRWKEFSQVSLFHSSTFVSQEVQNKVQWGENGGSRLVPEKGGDSVWALGTRVTVKTKGEETNGVYSTMEYHLSPGDGTDEHQHGNEDETWFLLDGTMKWKFEDQEYEAKKGDFVHMPRGKRHSFHNGSDKEAHMLVHCIPAGLEKYFLEIGKPVDTNSTSKKPTTTQEVAKMASEVAKKYKLSYFQAVQTLQESQNESQNPDSSTNRQSNRKGTDEKKETVEQKPKSTGPSPGDIMQKSKTEKGYQ